MNFKTVFLLSLFFFVCSCQSVENNHLEINPEKTNAHVHIGQGVWVNIPYGFKKAKSYEGFQAPNSAASISIKTNSKSIEEIKESFEPSNLKKKNTILLENSTVKYGDNEEALFTVVHDKRKETIRYLLAIAQGGRTYNLKAFYFKKASEGYNLEIRKALKSVFIGEHQEKEQLFKMASLNSFESMIYTRDGKFPTESEDQAIVEIETKKSIRGISAKKLIKQETTKITDEIVLTVMQESLVNGIFYEVNSQGNGKYAYLALIKSKNGKVILIKCHSNSSRSLEDYKTFTKNQFIKTTIR